MPKDSEIVRDLPARDVCDCIDAGKLSALDTEMYRKPLILRSWCLSFNLKLQVPVFACTRKLFSGFPESAMGFFASL